MYNYVIHVKRLHCNATVVFDGYGSVPSTLDITHIRRRSGRVVRDIDLSGNIPVCVKMDQILSNEANKQRLIIMLIRTLHGAGYGAIRSGIWQCGRVACPDNPSDRRDIGPPPSNVTVVLCEDTDLIVLLLLHTPTSCLDMSISYLNESTTAIKGQRCGKFRNSPTQITNCNFNLQFLRFFLEISHYLNFFTLLNLMKYSPLPMPSSKCKFFFADRYIFRIFFKFPIHKHPQNAPFLHLKLEKNDPLSTTHYRIKILHVTSQDF